MYSLILGFCLNNRAANIITNTDPTLCTNAPVIGVKTPIIPNIIAIVFSANEKIIPNLIV